MSEWLPEIDTWRAEGKRVAIATVVNAIGSAPRPVGARMAVADSGELAGSVSGGCVESAVAMEAEEVLRTGEPKLVRYGITDEMAWDVGLACGGTIDVFVEPVELASMTDDPGSNAATYLLRARRAVGEGMPAVIITVVQGEAIGAKVLVISGEIEGSLGSIEWDQRALALASEALSSEQGGLVALDSETDVFVDVFPLPSLLVIIGAVHVAQALVRLAQPLGFRIAVADARAALATPERFPTVDDLIVAWPDEAFGQLPITRTSAIVILTHDPKFDEPAILGALQTEAGYIGAVGSRKTNLERRERLREAGATDEQIDRVHGPIGLNIGGRTPEEMAISILAEIIAVRNGRPGGFLNQASGSIRAGSG